MFKRLFVLCLCLLLFGCASSERMARMSGGVFEDYQAPASARIRSEKYRKIQANSTPRYGIGVPQAGKRESEKHFQLNDNLINIWPLYFRSGQYTSMFWPLIDYDPYGFAFRPFYNHEGDDYSILFPLSAWNPVAKDGWCLLAAWGPDKWAVIPLAWSKHNKDNGYSIILPLYWHDWAFNTPTADAPYIYKENTFKLFLLGYYGLKLGVDTGAYSYLWDYSTHEKELNADLKAELAYRLADVKDVKIPTNKKEFLEFRQKIFDSLPEKIRTKYGLFPLIEINRSSTGEYSFNLIGPFFSYASSDTSVRTSSLWWLLGSYQARDYTNDSFIWTTTKRDASFASFLLMSYFKHWTGYEQTDEVEALRKISRMVGGSNDSFQKNINNIQEELGKLNLELPKTVTNARTLQLFLKDCLEKLDRPTYDEYNGFCLPAFWYSYGKKSSWWTIPLLLTGYNSRERDHKTRFWSVPLLSYFKRSDPEDVSTVAGPLLWYSSTKRFNRDGRTVFARDFYGAPAQGDLVEEINDHALFWLYYHGRFAYMVAREGYTHTQINEAIDALSELQAKERSLRDEQKNLDERVRRCANRVIKTKIQEYEKLIEEERIKETRQRLDERREEARKKRAEAQKKLAPFNIELPAEVTAKNADAITHDILDRFTELRSYTDYGNGFFWHKETYENGDGNWTVLFGLASGRKQKDAEQTQILHFLYRYTKDGDKAERLVFPFISTQQDGENSMSSFLWRIWMKKTVNGKTGGYFMFIPWGEI